MRKTDKQLIRSALYLYRRMGGVSNRNAVIVRDLKNRVQEYMDLAAEAKISLPVNSESVEDTDTEN